MGTGINGTPNEYDFGLEFDYSVWVPGTTIDLVNVTWDNNYVHTVHFESRTNLDKYIDDLRPAGLRIDQLSYVKPNQPVRLNIPHNRAIKYNYLRANNPLQPVSPQDEAKNYYYFIIGVNYVAPNTTELILQLDVWQTYIYDVRFGNCYIERGHVGIANTRQFDSFGRDYLTVPEGFDTGNEYQVVTQRKEWVMDPMPYSTGGRYPGYDVLVFSTTDLLADPGTASDPNLVSASGAVFQGTVHGANVYIFDADGFYAFMSNAAEYPWVTQGIVSITMVPKMARYHPGYTYAAFPMPTAAPSLPPANIAHDMYVNWREGSEFRDHVGDRYRILKKFWTYPYMVIEMTTFTATPIVLKPEAWNTPNANIVERASLVPPAQRIEFFPRFYNSKFYDASQTEVLWPSTTGYLGNQWGDDSGEYIDLVTQIANLPSMAIVNNGAVSYLASNAHGIAFSNHNADWTQQRAIGMAAGQYDIATGAMHTMQTLAGIAGNADASQVGTLNRKQAGQAMVSGVGNLVAGAGSGAVFGPVGMAAGAVSGVASGVTNGINTMLEIQGNDENLATRMTARAQSVIAEYGQAEKVRDTNSDLANWAARGDYANATAGINARVQDANLIQPTTSGQLGGETINIVNGGLQVSLRWKMLDKAHVKVIGEYWLRYGYAIRAFIKPPQNLHVMTRFTYWKMLESYIVAGAIPENHKQALRGIMEKGVTVWKDPNDIGVIDMAQNAPLPGVTY